MRRSPRRDAAGGGNLAMPMPSVGKRADRPGFSLARTPGGGSGDGGGQPRIARRLDRGAARDRTGRSVPVPGVAWFGGNAGAVSRSRTTASPDDIRLAAGAAFRHFRDADRGGASLPFDDESSSSPKTSASAVSAIRLRVPPPCAARAVPLLAAVSRSN